MNSVNIIGRTVAAIELRHTGNGTPVCDVNIAVDDGYGENKKSFFFNVQMWGKTAETAAQYLVKGQKIAVSGRLSQEEYTPNGQDKPVRKTRIVCEKLTMLEKPKDAAGSSPQQRSAPQQQQTAPAENFDDDTDVPF